MNNYNNTYNSLAILAISVAGIMQPAVANSEHKKPNIIIVITDDQGYGDLSCHGNPILKTPNLDNLYSQSTRLTNFHVSPSCTPTRASLFTGQYANRTGAWHTIGGRSLLKTSLTTIPEVLTKSGYSTGLFGKWHLGDNYPFRPHDRGFDEVFWHKGGGVGQMPDYWLNDYFNDTYFRKDTPEKVEGYCTDIWFKAAFDFMNQNIKAETPFFAYISANAPHGPYFVADKYSDKYKNVDGIINPYFYGMIDNLDENMGKLLSFLNEKNIADNTILIFMTDNGTSNGAGVVLEKNTDFVARGFNSGMRGSKISEYDGGHRVPFFFRWPNGGVKSGKDINELTAHIDLFPTLIDLLNIQKPDSVFFDGISLKNILTGKSKKTISRSVIVDNQRIDMPVKYKNYSVMNKDWRLVNGKELYKITDDTGQRNNIAAQNPGIVRKLKNDYEIWWESLKPAFAENPAITICPPQEPETVINAMDMHIDNELLPSPWHQDHIRKTVQNTGWYSVEVPVSGKYRVSLYRFPPESNLALTAIAPEAAPEYGTNVSAYKESDKLDIVKAVFYADSEVYESNIDSKSMYCSFDVHLINGIQKFRAEFELANKKRFAAFYFTVNRIN